MKKLRVAAARITELISRTWVGQHELALSARAMLSVLLSGLTVWLSVMFGNRLESGVFVWLFPVVIVSVWIGGLLCGILATATLALGAAYYHLPPYGDWSISRTADVLGLTAFAGSGLLASWLMDSLQQSNSLTHAVVVSIADAVITIDRRSRIRFMNPRAETLTGWSSEEAKRKRLEEVLQVRGAQGTDIDISGLAAEAMQERRAVSVPPCSFVLQKAGGSCPIEDSIAPICTAGAEVCGAVLLFRDDTNRRHNENALLEAERKYRDIFENAVVGMFQSTPEGRYLRVNRAMASMYGYDSPEQMVAAVHDIREQEYFDPSQRDVFERLVGQHLELRTFPLETKRRDGTRLSTIVNARVVRDSQGKALYYEGTQEDVTERKQLQMRLEHAQKMEAIGRMAGGIAHDFSNVLGIISGYCDLAEEQVPADHPILKFTTRIKTASGKGVDLTRQLLAVSRQQDIHPTVVDLNRVVRGLSQLLQGLVGEDISISFQCSDEIGLVMADPGQLEQVLMNLAVNARDAMPLGGNIRIETENLILDEHYAERHPPTVPGPHVVLSFSDTGHGIEKDVLPHIFEPFFTTKGPDKGTGLGLATVYGIVKQSNGNIWVYSEVGLGTTFKIFLPRIDTISKSEQSEAKTAGEGGTELILIVEDEAAMLEVAATMLESSGYRILRADSGAAALKIIRKSTERIDLLLSDVVMKDMAGPDLFARLQHSQPAAKVLYMSGYAGEKLKSYGHLDVLQKPFSKNNLLRRVRAILDSK